MEKWVKVVWRWPN